MFLQSDFQKICIILPRQTNNIHPKSHPPSCGRRVGVCIEVRSRPRGTSYVNPFFSLISSSFAILPCSHPSRCFLAPPVRDDANMYPPSVRRRAKYDGLAPGDGLNCYGLATHVAATTAPRSKATRGSRDVCLGIGLPVVLSKPASLVKSLRSSGRGE